MAIRRDIGDRSGEAAGLLSLVKALRAAGRPEDAQRSWLKAQQILAELGPQMPRSDQARTPPTMPAVLGTTTTSSPIRANCSGRISREFPPPR